MRGKLCCYVITPEKHYCLQTLHCKQAKLRKGHLKFVEYIKKCLKDITKNKLKILSGVGFDTQ